MLQFLKKLYYANKMFQIIYDETEWRCHNCESGVCGSCVKENAELIEKITNKKWKHWKKS